MGLLHDDYYEAVKDYLHPGIHDFINHYRWGHLIDLPPYHGCNRVNKNETRKRSNTKWANNVLFQLKNAIGENEKLNTKKKASFIGQDIWSKPGLDIYSKTKVNLFILLSLRSMNIWWNTDALSV